MLAEEYILIDISLFSRSPQLMNHGISAQQKTLAVVSHYNSPS